MAKKLVLSAALYLSLALLSTLAFANKTSEAIAGPIIETFLFHPASLSAAEPKTEHWEKLKDNTAHLPFDRKHSILLVNSHKRFFDDANYLLEFNNSNIESLDIYRYDHNNNSTSLLYENLGLNHPFDNRPTSYKNIAIPMDYDSSGNLSYLIHIEHSYGQKIQLAVWQDDQFILNLNKELIFFGMMYGSLLMIVIYNLFVYISLREKNHLWFFLFGACTGLFISFHEGHFFQFIAVEHIWPKSIFYAVISALMCFSFSLFSSYFLNLRRHSVILNRLLLSAGSIAAAFILLIGSSDNSLTFSPYILLIVLCLYSIAIGISMSVWYKGITSAGFFALAIFFCSVGLFAEFIARLPFTQFNNTVFSLSSVGNTAMVFVFASALADKMRILNKDKLEASKKLVKITEEKAQDSLKAYRNKLSEVQLKQESQAAKSRTKAKNEFLSTMGHEIRTPMSGVIGMTELLNDTKLDEEQIAYVESIKNSANALLNVINGLLDYSKIESGNMDLEARAFNLEKLVDDCVDIFALNSSEKKLSFTAYVKPETPLQLKGDAEKIKQITLNLLNALSHISGINNIVLQVSSTGKTSVNSVELLFDIQVRGIALDKKALKNFFEQLDNDEDSSRNASILNVKVSKQLLELMHGELSLQLNDDGFNLSYNTRLLIPHVREEQKLEERQHVLSNRHLLLCHSNPDIINYISELTRSWGMQCVVAENSHDLSQKLLDDKQNYQIVMLEDSVLTPELQINIRQSNVDHNFIASLIVINDTQLISPEETKRRGIQCLLKPPFTTADLFNALTLSMGIQPHERIVSFDAEKNILIAEDNLINLMVIQGMLKKLGLSADTAPNGLEAVIRAKNKHYDLIFMDCEMPELDGYEATHAIREFEHEALEEQPSVIIGLSAHDEVEYKSRAEVSGMNDFLAKPLNSDDLESLLQRFLNASPDENEDI